MLLTEDIQENMRKYIEELEQISPGQPISWYEMQAKNQKQIQEKMIAAGVLVEVKVYHDNNSSKFDIFEKNYLFSIWVDRSSSKYETKTLDEILYSLLEERGLSNTEYKTIGKGFIVVNSLFNKKLKLTKEDYRNFSRYGFKFVYSEINKKGKEVIVFQKEISDQEKPWKTFKGYEVIKAYKEDLLDGSLFEMFKLGYSR